MSASTPSKMKLKIKKTHPDAVIPKYATPGSAGFDLVAVEDVEVLAGSTALVSTGLAFEVPEGFEMQIRPRSGMSLKTPLRVANSPGCIDSDFRGTVQVIMHNTETFSPEAPLSYYKIKKGERIAQAMICPIIQVEMEVVDYLSETQRGEGGFGHTGK